MKPRLRRHGGVRARITSEARYHDGKMTCMKALASTPDNILLEASANAGENITGVACSPAGERIRVKPGGALSSMGYATEDASAAAYR